MEDISNSEDKYKINLNKIVKYCINISKISFNKDAEQNNIIIEEEKSEDNILLKYINDSSILNNQSNLTKFFKELEMQIVSGNNILLPFLQVLPNLIKLYINNNIDEKESLKYINIFKLLKFNCFISRENLYPIYEYFSSLFDHKNNNEENELNLDKFNKVFKLWKIFYKFDHKENMIISPSSFCFIGGCLKVNLTDEVSLDNYSLLIKIDFLKFLNINNNLILMKTEGENSFKLDNSSLQYLLKSENVKTISIEFKEKYKINIEYYGDESKSETITLKSSLIKLKEFYLLENFFGQIKSFEIIKMKKDDSNKDENSNSINNKINNDNIIFHEIFEPYPLSDNILYHRSMINNNNSNVIDLKYTIKENKDSNVLINIVDSKLIKVNYINYLDESFNLIEYLGGLAPLIPFIQLINQIIQNKKINRINGTDKIIYLRNIFDTILNLVCKILVKYFNKLEKNIQKYCLFSLSYILQINNKIIDNIDNEAPSAKRVNILELTRLFDDKDNYIFSFFYGELMNKAGDDNFNKNLNKDGNIHNFKDKMKKEFKKEKTPILISSSHKQLYKSLIKELFIYNRYWSIKELFFGKQKDKANNNKLNLSIKYKQLSYYTQSFQQPILYPILELDENIPSFSRFNKEKLFNHDFNEKVNYKFNFKDNIISQIVKKNNPLYKNNKIKCCLVKKNCHVKGEIYIIQRKININDSQFEIIFCSDSDNNGETCNKIAKNNQKITNANANNILNSNKDEICFGSVFPALPKEFNRKILIKSKDIKFLLIRNYYRRTSAIEIFTYKSNKSYYFNFKEFIDINNPKNNLLLKEIEENKNFQKLNYHKAFTLYYNNRYKSTMFPLFFEDHFNLEKKLKFYNNYDLLTIINLLSNRSFRDLYQYPIFPILYKPNNILENEKNKERDLGQHIGIQDLNSKSKERKKLIEEAYISSLDDEPDGNEEEESEPNLFNTHYSNIIYASNYLIRIFPYSLIGIELQGDGFDSPNRLFFSVKKLMENTLSQKSDLREMIPEIYYFPDLYANTNDLCLGMNSKGQDINNISVKEKINNQNEDPYEKYEFLSRYKNYLEFENLKLNKWINLIFGKNQKETKGKNRKYINYSKNMYINFEDEKQKKYLKDYIIMQQYEFGIQPLSIFDNKFPELKDKSKYFKQIKEYNRIQFIKEHHIIKGDKNKCFLCEGFNNKHPDYIEILKKKGNKKKIEDLSDFEKYFKEKEKLMFFFHYIFIGDVLGNISIYECKMEINNKKSKKETDKNSPKKKRDHRKDSGNNSNEKKYKEIKKITDHYKQIKYIDYNTRLNLFLSYSLDGFINIYTFPKCKLVRAIKVCNITDSEEILQKVALVSNPFPMIFFYDKNNMYLITLNGDLIKKTKIKYDNFEIYPIIDKNCGVVNDEILIENLDAKGNNKEEIFLPSLSNKL